MTAVEMSDQFDVLYNNIMSNAAPGLNEYEKSVFLTKAQDEIIKNYFNPKGNKYQEGYDGSAKRQIDFSKLMKVATVVLATSAGSFDPRAKVGALPSDVLVVINEMLTLTTAQNAAAGTRQIIPITYEEYARLMSKPYKEPLKNQAWRLITGQNASAIVEVIINNNDSALTPTYKMRYVRRPQPIVVANLVSAVGDGVSVNGVTTQTNCELDESIHQEILQRAVELAKAAYASDQNGQLQMQDQITVGQRSE